ncbi:MAG: amino acid ABC transporter permease [Candidatus Hodarchaeota archaeon]
MILQDDIFIDIFYFGEILSKFGNALLVTLLIAGMGILIGFGIGLLLGIGNSFGGKVTRGICSFYVEVVRGTPLLVQILIWYYLVPFPFRTYINGFEIFGEIDNFFGGLVGQGANFSFAAVLAIGLHSAAYQAEIVRAGINSIPSGQTEAGLSIGLSKQQVIQHIILPQSMRMNIPPMINEFVIVIKDSSLAGYITVVDITKMADVILLEGGRPIETLLLLAGIYLVICITVSFIAKYVEKKFQVAGYGVKSRRSLL